MVLKFSDLLLHVLGITLTNLPNLNFVFEFEAFDRLLVQVFFLVLALREIFRSIFIFIGRCQVSWLFHHHFLVVSNDCLQINESVIPVLRLNLPLLLLKLFCQKMRSLIHILRVVHGLLLSLSITLGLNVLTLRLLVVLLLLVVSLVLVILLHLGILLIIIRLSLMVVRRLLVVRVLISVVLLVRIPVVLTILLVVCHIENYINYYRAFL